MAPFEALYGRRCRTPLSWSQTGECKIFGPDLVTEAEENVKIIQSNLKAAQSRQKSYADKRRKPLQFEVCNFVYLWVSPTRGVQRFGIKGNLAPRYVGPFEILEACGPIAYRLQLPPQLAAVHDVFHVSQLRKCIKTPSEIINPQAVEIESDLSYIEHPIRILDTKERSIRRETVRMFKIQWNHLLSPYSGRAKSGPRSKMGLGKGYGRITDRILYGCLRPVRPCKLKLRQLGFVLCLARVS
jgi:hypothetical protein